MKNAKVVIGATFGDEGKGLMTDYFCSQFPKTSKVLNVRFNGGSQAGHTVKKEGEYPFVFHHLGAGSFNKNTETYLDKYFIVNPITFKQEFEQVKTKIYAHKDCLVTLPCDMMLNAYKEKIRGTSKHGSCGLGIFETIERNKTESFSLSLADLLRFDKDVLFTQINYTHRAYAQDKFDEKSDYYELVVDENIINKYIEDVLFFLDNVEIVNETILEKFENVVFEGSQGLLLDQNNIEYFPHLTPSNTGVANIINYLQKCENYEICYVMRSYMTRHGAGKFVTETEFYNINKNVCDYTNMPNEFQGSLRYGYFDLDLIKNAIYKDISNGLKIDNCVISVTHLDQTDNKIILNSFNHISIESLQEKLNIKIKYNSENSSSYYVQLRKEE